MSCGGTPASAASRCPVCGAVRCSLAVAHRSLAFPLALHNRARYNRNTHVASQSPLSAPPSPRTRTAVRASRQPARPPSPTSTRDPRARPGGRSATASAGAQRGAPGHRARSGWVARGRDTKAPRWPFPDTAADSLYALKLVVVRAYHRHVEGRERALEVGLLHERDVRREGGEVEELHAILIRRVPAARRAEVARATGVAAWMSRGISKKERVGKPARGEASGRAWRGSALWGGLTLQRQRLSRRKRRSGRRAAAGAIGSKSPQGPPPGTTAATPRR